MNTIQLLPIFYDNFLALHFPGPATLPSRAASIPSSSPVASSSQAASSSSPVASSSQAAEVEEVSAPLKKKIDLSGKPITVITVSNHYTSLRSASHSNSTSYLGVAPAAKKRRALAACKKPDTRKFARAGSEAKCTESAMKGDYDNIIEALEYGK